MKKTLTVVLGFLLISCLTEPKNETVTESVQDSPANNSESTNYNVANQSVTQKKFVYIILEADIPVLGGYKSESVGIDSFCYILYEKESYITDVIEVNNYNEDSKYRLLDEAEKKALDKNLYIGDNLYSNAVATYGYKAAESLKDKKPMIKVTNREIFEFDSYSEASIHRKNRKNNALE